MKKLGFILMACALIMGTEQCKKNDEVSKPENGGKSTFITLNVGGGNRANIVPEDDIAPVYYSEGDMIHVISDGKYIGTLTYNGSNFVGDITNPTEGQPLHFYFLGNVTPTESLVVGETSACSVVISNQKTSHPVISYAPSTQNYSVGSTNYTATLLNKCALVKFNVTTVSENATCITGMNNKVTVDFETNEFAYSKEGDGVITLSAGEGEKWVILLPQDEVNQTEAHSADGIYTGTCASIPVIAENDYQVNGITVTISHPTGAINGLFTINPNGDQVYFSQGNLQYQASTNTWRFAEHQWDYVGTQHARDGHNGGTVSGSDNFYASSTYNGWIDLFGWGTSGWHDSNDLYNVYYQPWSTSCQIVNVDYNYYGYGPSINMPSPDLTGSSANYDWGVYNPISNGGNMPGQWRTLTKDERTYMLDTRVTFSGIRYAGAEVNGITGVIILPDNWNSSYYNLNDTNQGGGTTSNIISLSTWINSLENYGAVFLPDAGQRYTTQSPTNIGGVGYMGVYWLSTHWSGSSQHAHSNHNPISYTGEWRCTGHSVRLVQDY